MVDPHACETVVIGAMWLELWLVDMYLTNYKISNSILYWPRYTDIEQIPYPTPTQKSQTRTLSPYPIMILSPFKDPSIHSSLIHTHAACTVIIS